MGCWQRIGKQSDDPGRAAEFANRWLDGPSRCVDVAGRIVPRIAGASSVIASGVSSKDERLADRTSEEYILLRRKGPFADADGETGGRDLENEYPSDSFRLGGRRE